MSVFTKGLLSLVFWLIVGVGFTEVTVLSLNAWMMHDRHSQPFDSVAAMKVDPPN